MAGFEVITEVCDNFRLRVTIDDRNPLGRSCAWHELEVSVLTSAPLYALQVFGYIVNANSSAFSVGACLPKEGTPYRHFPRAMAASLWSGSINLSLHALKWKNTVVTLGYLREIWHLYLDNGAHGPVAMTSVAVANRTVDPVYCLSVANVLRLHWLSSTDSAAAGSSEEGSGYADPACRSHLLSFQFITLAHMLTWWHFFARLHLVEHQIRP
jgi:hypothetical protein